jgi:hypothetical protein
MVDHNANKMKTAKIYTLNISAWFDSKLNKTGKKILSHYTKSL